MGKYGKITLGSLEALDNSGIEGCATMLSELCASAFELVADPKDWKAPINKIVRFDAIEYTPDALAYAVKYMTATEVTMTPVSNHETRVTSVGYRMGPAGDH